MQETANVETYTQRKLTMPITRNSITQQVPQYSKHTSTVKRAMEANGEKEDKDDGWETVKSQSNIIQIDISNMHLSLKLFYDQRIAKPNDKHAHHQRHR